MSNVRLENRTVRPNVLLLIILASLILVLIYPTEINKKDIIEIYNQDYFYSLVEEHRALVIFSSETCPDCVELMGRYNEIRGLLQDDVLLIEVLYKPGLTDELFKNYAITVTPTFMVVSEKKVIARHDGILSKKPEDIARWVSASLSSQGVDNQDKYGYSIYKLGLFTAVVLGFLTAFSPCSLPFLLMISTSLVKEGLTNKKSLQKFMPFFIFSLGTFFSLLLLTFFFSLVSKLILKTLFFLGFVLVFTGFCSLYDDHPNNFSFGVGKRDFYAIYFLSGLVATQCNAPLLLGSAAIISYSMNYGDLLLGILTLFGMWIVYLLALVAMMIVSRKIDLFVRYSSWIEKATGIVFIIVGIVILLR